MPATPKRRGREAKDGSLFLSDVLAGNVRAARARLDWSQEHVAGRMATMGHEWSRATVSEVERSGRSVSMDEFFAVAMALGVNPLELLHPHGARVDLGGDIPPVPTNFIVHWLAGRVRVEVDAAAESKGLLIEWQRAEEDASDRPATAAETIAFFESST